MDAKRMLMESIEVSLLMEFEKDMDLLNGIMEKSFKENGKMEQKMVLEYGDLPKEISIKEIGF